MSILSETPVGDLLSTKEVSEQVFGGKVSPFSIRRWIVKGVGQPPVFLRAIRLGSSLFVTRADAEDFVEAMKNPTLWQRKQTTKRFATAKRK